MPPVQHANLMGAVMFIGSVIRWSSASTSDGSIAMIRGSRRRIPDGHLIAVISSPGPLT
jgi:hypothetical protein